VYLQSANHMNMKAWVLHSTHPIASAHPACCASNTVCW